jgi:glycosyltransferase involved in cell wall biosynthesis
MSAASYERIIYLANPYSPHVRAWEELCQDLGVAPEIWHASVPEQGNGTPAGHFLALLPSRLQRWPASIRYLLAGVIARWRLRRVDKCVLHAHNASGYGLCALVTGRPYLLTVYGTEVYDHAARGVVYTALLKKVLAGAQCITASTPAMSEYLAAELGVDEGKVRAFSLGVPAAFAEGSQEPVKEVREFSEGRDVLLVSNRRIHPHYNIEYLVDEFADMSKRGRARYGLILLAGDCDKNYMKSIARKVSSSGLSQHILLIDRFITPSEMAWVLSRADYCISLANSDQLSSSILEAVASGAIPVVTNLSAYRPLQEVNAALTVDELKAGALADLLGEVEQNPSRKQQLTRALAVYAEDNLSRDRVRGKVAELYGDISAPN